MNIQEQLIHEYGTNTLFIVAFIIALAIGAGVMLTQRIIDNRRSRKMDMLQECGAIPFVVEVLMLKDTIGLLNDLEARGHSRELAIAWARKHQQMVPTFGERTVTGTVCGEEISGIVENGELNLFVENQATKEAIEASVAWFMQYVQSYDFDLGIRLKVDLSVVS